MAISSSRYVNIATGVTPSFSGGSGGGGVTPEPPQDSWILDQGIWEDAGIWEDDKLWIDGV